MAKKKASKRTAAVTKPVAADGSGSARARSAADRRAEAAAKARALAAKAAKRAKAAAKEVSVIAKVAATAAAHEYEDRLHDAAIKGATALELGAVKAAGALRGLVALRRKVRRGGGA